MCDLFFRVRHRVFPVVPLPGESVTWQVRKAPSGASGARDSKRAAAGFGAEPQYHRAAALPPASKPTKKAPGFFLPGALKPAATYSPTWYRSTIGASELNFSVRDGKRWILAAITA